MRARPYISGFSVAGRARAATSRYALGGGGTHGQPPLTTGHAGDFECADCSRAFCGRCRWILAFLPVWRAGGRPNPALFVIGADEYDTAFSTSAASSSTTAPAPRC